ncbi:MAG: J domain-containing protein [Pseudomonadota bacterium]
MADLVKALRILNVTPDDDAETIRKAWRALVRTYRPDTARRDPLLASKTLADINTAFEAVCACDTGALEKLRSDIAAQRKRAEQKRREAMNRLKNAQVKRAAVEDVAESSRRKTTMADRYRAQVRQVQAVTGNTSTIDRAEKGFHEAMGICSLLNFAQVRSSYV